MKSIKKTISGFIADDCTTMAAALAYYTLFALPPLLLVIISIVGLALGHERAQGKIQEQIQGLIGSDAAGQVGTMVQKAGEKRSSGVTGMILGLAALLFGATTAFAQLQASLNRIWHVKADPNQGGIKNFITHRLLSFGMLVGVAFLLLVSLAVSAAVAAVGGAIEGWLPGFSQSLLMAINFAISFVVFALLFAAVFKVLPDVQIEWRQVRAGAIVTALLFTIGKYLIGLYLGKSGAASPYGAAGSLVLIVLWIYYSSILVLMGAEFTRVWAEASEGPAQPKEGAVRDLPMQQAPAQ